MQIPCKHLQWICELFKRLNSLKNLVCTGAVCHRRHPPFVTLRHSLYRTLVVPPYPKLRATVLPSLSLSPSLFPFFPLCPSICQFLPRLSYPFVFLTIDILRSVKKRTNLPPSLVSFFRRPDVEQIIRAENPRKSLPWINLPPTFNRAPGSFDFRATLRPPASDPIAYLLSGQYGDGIRLL